MPLFHSLWLTIDMKNMSHSAIFGRTASPSSTSRGLTAGSSEAAMLMDPAVKPRDVGCRLRAGQMQRGFTLIEMIIVMVIMGILLATGVKFLTMGFNAWSRGQGYVDADSQGRVALSRIAMDLHNLRSAPDIATATATTLAFTDLYGNAVSYQLSGTQLQRNGLGLANYVQSINFSYFTCAGGTLTPPVTGANIALICFIQASLVINENSNYSFFTGVALWNTL